MKLTLEYQEMPHWPPLAWLARCEHGESRIRVRHGRRIEKTEEWFCEAVWDGPYAAGDFDSTDLVFGSGGRLREGRISFVSSGATVDRLQSIEREGSLLVSNSLACLLACSGSQLADGSEGFSGFFGSVQHGLEKVDRSLPLSDGVARLVYFANLEWDGQGSWEVPKRPPRRDFSSFERYAGFLRSGLRDIAVNLSSQDRAFPYEWLGTMSRGYDSPAVAALASEAGLRRVVSFAEGRPGVPDDGEKIAEVLGLEIAVLPRLGWQTGRPWEALFLAGDARGRDAVMAAASGCLADRVLLTGFGGDSVWSRQPESLTPGLVRGGYSGLSLTEFRLHQGFIHLPAPFMGMTQIADVFEITHSAELAPWHVVTSYSRPIARRVLEERGVPRDLFGQKKTGASVRYLAGEDAWSAAGRSDFFRWVRDGSAVSQPLASILVERAAALLGQLIGRGARVAPGRLGVALQKLHYKLPRLLRKRRRLRVFDDLAFRWAMDRVGRSYQRDPSQAESGID